MPILRVYCCPECNHRVEVTLRSDQWDEPPPSCEVCEAHAMGQDFRFAIGGSNAARAAALAEDIASKDYRVADMKVDHREGAVPQVRYKDTTPAQINPSTWGSANQEMLEGAAAAGRQVRLRHGSGLDVLASGLKDGSIPDLIEVSKRRSLRVF